MTNLSIGQTLRQMDQNILLAVSSNFFYFSEQKQSPLFDVLEIKLAIVSSVYLQ